MTKKIAVVILNYNGSSYLKTFLPIVCRYSEAADVYVVDNGSTDDSLAYLSTQKEVIILKHDKNLGFTEGYNVALQQIENDYYVLLNSDIEVTENWLDPMIQLLESSPTIVACQPKILSYKEKQKFEYAGAGGGYLDLFGYPFCRGRIFNLIECDWGQYDDNAPIFWATGACLMIKRSYFHKVGGFDSEFFAHMEEIDLCWRLQRRGLTIYSVGSSKVYHIGGGTLDSESPFKTYLNFRNNLALLFKNLPKIDLFYILPLRFFLDGLVAFRFLIFGQPKHFWSILKGYFDFYSRIGYWYNVRMTERSLSDSQESDLFVPRERKSVLLRYFIDKTISMVLPQSKVKEVQSNEVVPVKC